MNIDKLPKVEDYVEKLVPLMSKLQVPVNSHGEVPPQVLMQMLSQAVVTQRYLQLELDLQAIKLTSMFTYMVANPPPAMDAGIEIQTWVEALCKYLHIKLQEHLEEVAHIIQEQEQKHMSQLVVPNSSTPRIIMPK